MTQKQQDAAERQIVEQSIRDAQENDQKLQVERRQYLKALTEEDRKAKLLQKMKANPEPEGFSGNDHISKLFDRPTHVSYERRKN